MSRAPHNSRPDPLIARYHRAAPEVSIDPAAVLKAGKRRRLTRTAGAAAVAALTVTGAGWAVTELPMSSGTAVATQEPTESTGQPSDAVAEEVLALADELEANAQPVPEGMAFHYEGTDWLVTSNTVEMIGEERTSNPDGTIVQVEILAGSGSDLVVGDPMPADAERTETGPIEQGRPDWAFEEDLPLDPDELRQAWVDSCPLAPSVGATEYRCVYVGMQEAVPIATDALAAAALRVLAAEPDVEIERITDMLGRERIAATFDLPDEGLWSYLIDPETGRIDGAQTSGEYSTSIGTFTTEWVDPVSDS
ncbi:hypothetical protein IM660_03315 [Ruania alkalisoli]|uniref:Uncharacterized protein n=1 Tax=Ruania alkalisoli TaxID=2779775 RepID=A0A7M1SWL9_9MICO|nr:hypothetical protein [Ruania alkalisoli]QOR71344.1 hypothetical protein IM660_03315 [Ruania alkalisoli]